MFDHAVFTNQCSDPIHRLRHLQGMQAQITKAVISQALLFGIKDYMEGYTFILMLAFAKWRTGLASGKLAA